MCGRTACTLEPDDICRAYSYKDGQGNWKVPQWKDAPNGRNYYPSYNIPPTSHTPIIFSEKYIDENSDDFIIQPMHWGIVPHWHKGSYKDFTLNLNNARFETVLKSRLFSVPLNAGRRCVVLADGYYEWQSSKTGKQPYFIYFPQPKGIQIENNDWKNLDLWNETNGWLGPRLLTMAGIFETWNNPDDGQALYSYSIITMEASSAVNTVHERMPAILDGWQAIQDWLDYKNVPLKEAMKLIVPSINLTMHPVTKEVGKSSYKSSDCKKPIDLKKADKSSNFMKNWLKTGMASKNETESPKKKFKTEND